MDKLLSDPRFYTKIDGDEIFVYKKGRKTPLGFVFEERPADWVAAFTGREMGLGMIETKEEAIYIVIKEYLDSLW